MGGGESVTGERLRQGPPIYPFTLTHNNCSTLKPSTPISVLQILKIGIKNKGTELKTYTFKKNLIKHHACNIEQSKISLTAFRMCTPSSYIYVYFLIDKLKHKTTLKLVLSEKHISVLQYIERQSKLHYHILLDKFNINLGIRELYKHNITSIIYYIELTISLKLNFQCK